VEIPRHLERIADPPCGHHRARGGDALGESQLLIHGNAPLASRGVIDQLDGLVEIVGQGFLTQQVLAGIEQRRGDAALDPRKHRDVHDGHGVVASDRVHGIVDLADAVSRCDRLGPFPVAIHDADHLQAVRRIGGQVRQVDDFTGTDDCDRTFVVFARISSRRGWGRCQASLRLPVCGIVQSFQISRAGILLC
jgi:hypothetical protein